MFNSFTYVAPMDDLRLAKKKSLIDGAKVPPKKTKGQFCLKKGCYTARKMGQNLHLPRGAATNYASWWRVCMYYERENWSQAGSKRVQWSNKGILKKITKSMIIAHCLNLL